MKRATLLAVLILLAAAAPAHAGFPYPGQTPVTDARSLEAIGVGLAYWRAHGLTACPDGVQTSMADNLQDADGIDAQGRGGDCQAAVARQPLNDLRESLISPTILEERYAAQEECALWTHELGHALGLGHTEDGGVMDSSRPGMPVECVRWARTAFPAASYRSLRAHPVKRAARVHYRVPLTKRQAHTAGLRFVEPVVDLLDVDKPSIPTHMDPPSKCERVNRRTVDCYFWAYLEADHRTVSGFLRIHRQRDGLIGVLLPWDPARLMVRRTPVLVSG